MSGTDYIQHKIMIMSGKGGVGKTTVAVNLALALAENGQNVGLLDADITGPNIPKMLKLEDEILSGDGERLVPVYLPIGCDHGISVMSMAFMIERDAAIPWYSPTRLGMLRHFVDEVQWGLLDYLMIDLPPGTGDEPLSIATMLDVDGAIIVTTPQDVAILDARKAINMAKEAGIPIIGIIENMSGFTCPRCGSPINLFGEGGGKRVADEMDVPFLGSIPIDPMIVRSGDDGIPFVATPHSSTVRLFEEIVERVYDAVNA